ncbi:C-C motif chemokine 21-like [Pseudophryne corroboree]|uniref:C-C motif chemokine 21-like n=1 Tax=Pseudophryne corroboree TaxID=495146 RepID=UPI003082066F
MALPVSLIFLAIAAVCAIPPVSSANRNPSDCCLGTKSKEIPSNRVKCYIKQDLSTGCNIEAVIFVTRFGKHLCAPPNEKWVKDLRKQKKKCPTKAA